jgi:hypothetical protein
MQLLEKVRNRNARNWIRKLEDAPRDKGSFGAFLQILAEPTNSCSGRRIGETDERTCLEMISDRRIQPADHVDDMENTHYAAEADLQYADDVLAFVDDDFEHFVDDCC